jgi:hypothetical protein
VGTGTQTAEASEAHLCVPYLRNDALEGKFCEVHIQESASMYRLVMWVESFGPLGLTWVITRYLGAA